MLTGYSKKSSLLSMDDFDQNLLVDNDLRSGIKNNKFVILIGLVGFFLLFWGVAGAVRQNTQENSVEIISADDTSQEKQVVQEIIIDISGAVETPGVYQFPLGSRINDALVAAGGLSASADRVWVTRYLNRAGTLSDGSKIYIPHEGEELGTSIPSNSGLSGVSNTPGISQGSVAGSTTSININTAGATELDTLWGIGTARAQQIIDNRPYTALEELMTKAGIPKNVYERISTQISL